MMHELLDLRECLFHSDRRLDAKTMYERKLEIIQANVYGVDIDPFATNTAMLRLWLSLAVEADKPEPLPNLDFKIGTGDSLAAPDPSGGGQLVLQRPLVEEFLALKREYLLAHSQRKKELRRKIDDVRDRIRAWTGFKPDPGVFDWAVEFAEAFLADDVRTTLDAQFGFMGEAHDQLALTIPTGTSSGGFDIVLANPPYVRQEAIRHLSRYRQRIAVHFRCQRALRDQLLLHYSHG